MRNLLLVRAAPIAAYSALFEEDTAIISHLMADSSNEEGSGTSSDEEGVFGEGRGYIEDGVEEWRGGGGEGGRGGAFYVIGSFNPCVIKLITTLADDCKIEKRT